jgi:hypothetical protein
MWLRKMKLAEGSARRPFRIAAAVLGALLLLGGIYPFLADSPATRGDQMLRLMFGAAFLYAAFTGYWPVARRPPGG